MSKATKAVADSTVILFGLNSIGKPKAGAFKGTEVQAARKAAAKLGLKILNLSKEAGRELADKVPPGRIQAHGEAVVSFVSKSVYDSIETLAGPKPESAGAGSSKASEPRLPANWDDIKAGDRVLAQDTDPKDGWWQVTVVEKSGDVFKMRWPRSERGRPFQKHKLTLGLICPTQADDASKAESTKTPGGTNPRFPQHWAAIGVDQIVLTKEDGPCEQWWEAKTVKLDGDMFTLQWRDCPNLPLIVRPRSSLGLVHPAPKAR